MPGHYGVFRYYPPRYWSPRPRIATAPRSVPIFALPDPAELCSGKRARFGFYSVDSIGMILQATAGAQIRIGANISSVDGTATSSTTGDYLELLALNDNLWGAISEIPGGAWTLA